MIQAAIWPSTLTSGMGKRLQVTPLLVQHMAHFHDRQAIAYDYPARADLLIDKWRDNSTVAPGIYEDPERC